MSLYQITRTLTQPDGEWHRPAVARLARTLHRTPVEVGIRIIGELKVTSLRRRTWREALDLAVRAAGAERSMADDLAALNAAYDAKVASNEAEAQRIAHDLGYDLDDISYEIARRESAGSFGTTLERELTPLYVRALAIATERRKSLAIVAAE